MNVIGNVTGKTCVIIDDMVDTAGTLVGSVAALKSNGAERVLACFTHALLSGPAMGRLTDSEIECVVATDTLSLSAEKSGHPKIIVLGVASLLGEAIARIHSSASVSSLFV
jgi:ribose-phosphate pyrophosphokinase